MRFRNEADIEARRAGPWRAATRFGGHTDRDAGLFGKTGDSAAEGFRLGLSAVSVDLSIGQARWRHLAWRRVSANRAMVQRCPELSSKRGGMGMPMSFLEPTDKTGIASMQAAVLLAVYRICPVVLIVLC